MGYLNCKKCGGNYELQEGESPKDFDKCQCGGDLKYVENVDVHLNLLKKLIGNLDSKKLFKFSIDSLQSRLTIILKKINSPKLRRNNLRRPSSNSNQSFKRNSDFN